MLTITPSVEKAVVAEYCKRCKRPYSEAFYLYRAEDRGETLAVCLFEVGASEVRVLLYEGADQDDLYLFDGLLRAGLNYASEHGIENGCIPEEFRQRHEALFAKLNYPVQRVFNITNFFSKYKNCTGG